MLIDFSVKNYRSIKDMQTLSFVTTGLKSADKYADVDANNIISEGDHHYFKTIGIYGANASGKSNIIKALTYFCQIVSKEASSSSNLGRLNEPFLYQSDPYNSESFFQITLSIKGKIYRYGFTIKKNPEKKSPVSTTTSNEIIESEWLIGPVVKNKKELFTRKGNQIKNSNLPNKKAIPPLTYDHTLYLTHAAAFDKNGICALIKQRFMSLVFSNNANYEDTFRYLSLYQIEKSNKKKQFLNGLSSFNLKYDDVFLKKEDGKDEIFPAHREKIFFTKNYNNNSKQEKRLLNLNLNESSGTQKLFDLMGLLLFVMDVNYPLLIILDEIDSNFHPYLVLELIKLFNNPKINTSGSQLLFTSHDTNLMNPGIMRRDQFYFTEKMEDDSTRLYSLADLRGIRNDADFARQYLEGMYGGVPSIAEIFNANDE